jgi:hypothetical protein
MALNFNIEPFYDDYSEDKQFYRILFRPGYAVQARELTQLQTILQQQIKRHGDHMFKNGAMIIPGQISYDSKTSYVKLKPEISASSIVKTYSVLSSTIGKTYRGQTSGVEAIILTATPAEVVSGVAEPDTLFVKYTRGSGKFSLNEIISPIDGSSGLDLVVQASDALGTGTTATIERGVYYIKDNFVLVQGQTTVLSKYSGSATGKAGLKVVESITYPEEDESLLDNALGSPNYAAPGAARYYIDLQLTTVAYDATTDSGEFIPLLVLVDGKVQFLVDKTEYAQIEKTLARRTFDESGDYAVREFPIEVREYRNNDRGAWANNITYIKGDIVTSGGTTYKCILSHTSASTGSFAVGSNWLEDITPLYNYGVNKGPTYTLTPNTDVVPLTAKMSLAVEPGKAYVRGYEIEKITTQFLTLDKARDLSDYETQTLDTSPGNYVLIRSPHALPDINYDVVFYDKYSGTAGTAPSGGNQVATARVKQIQYHSAGVYKLFLFNVSVSAGKNFNRDAKFVFSTGSGSNAATRFSSQLQPVLTELSGSLSAASSTATLTGVNTAFITELKQYDYVSIAGVEYQVTGTISSNSSITIDTAISVAVGTKIYRVGSQIVDPDNLSSVFRLPRYAVNDTRNVHYSFYKKASNVTSPNTITETGYSFGVTTDNRNYIVVDRSNGNFLTYTSSGSPSSGQFTVSGAGTSSATFTINGTGPYDIIYNVRKASDGSSAKLKILTTITETVSLSGGVATLSKADGFELISVISGSTNVTSSFVFDGGKKDSHYDLSKISVVAGATVTGSVTVKYNYFAHQAGGDYYAIDSYTHGSSNVEYSELQSTAINTVDFRPIRNTDGTFASGVITPKYGEETDVQYNYYLGRIDKLSLDYSGQFLITKGVPSASPKEPNSPKNSMDLYTFNIEPYTFSGNSNSVKINRIENKRYTMRDIGKLENRIKNLEYYTTLSMLEQNTANVKAYDQYGLERPQNGFMVDSFTGQGIGNSVSADWKASIDVTAGELRPTYVQNNIALYESIGTNLNRTGRNYNVYGDLLMLKVASTTPLVSQLRASHSESVNPFNIFTFAGTLEINPWSDTWFETARRPDVIINDNSKYDAVVKKANADGVLGTVWKLWQTNWQGEVVTGTTSARQQNQGGGWTEDGGFIQGNVTNRIIGGLDVGTRGGGEGIRDVTVTAFAQQGTALYKGTNTFIQTTTTNTVISDKIVSTEVIPYIRSRKILFRGDAFKPETRMYAFFDGSSVDSYIAPAKRMVFVPYGTTTIPTFATDVNVGSNINSDARKVSNDVTGAYSYGEVLREYVSVSGGTPTATGVTCIVLGQETHGGVNYAYIDNIRGGSGSLSTSTSSNVYYLEAEFNSARKVQMISVTTPTELKTTFTGQLFGVYTIPNTTTMSFRTGTRRLRFTDTPDNVRLNESTSAETTYSASGVLNTYERTVLSTKTAEVVTEQLQDKTESVNRTSSRITRDTGWYDPLAETFLVDVEGGVFITDVDLFFAAKDTNVPVKVQIRNTDNGYPGSTILPYSEVVLRPSSVNVSATGQVATKFTFKAPVYLQSGVEYALVVLSDSAKYKVWIAQAGEIDINGSGLISTQPYAGVLFKSQNGSTWTADQTQDMKFILNRAVFSTGSTATVDLINQHVSTAIPYDLYNLDVNKIVLPGTAITATVGGSTVNLGENIYLNSVDSIDTAATENGTPSFTATMYLSTTVANISPVIDLSRCSVTLIHNIIDSTSNYVENSGSNDNEKYPEIGNALAKYVTKQVRLNQAATNLRIIFDANVPNDADIDVYYRIGNASDASFFDSEYVLVNSFTKSYIKTENARSFGEVEAQLELSAFDAVQIKLVFKSVNSSKVPRVKDLRVIAYA